MFKMIIYVFYQCRATVMDSYLPCRLAVYRSNASHTAVKGLSTYNELLFTQPAVCNSAGEFDALSRAMERLQSDGGLKEIAISAKRQCPDYCTKILYKTELSSVSRTQFGKTVQPLISNQSIDMLKLDALEWAWQVVLVSDSVLTMTQFYSYDLNQFIAEIGGSWGLFLGASLMTLFGFVDKIIDRVTKKTQI